MPHIYGIKLRLKVLICSSVSQLCVIKPIKSKEITPNKSSDYFLIFLFKFFERVNLVSHYLRCTAVVTDIFISFVFPQFISFHSEKGA